MAQPPFIVEDNDTIQNLTRKLREEGIQLSSTADAVTAWAISQGSHPFRGDIVPIEITPRLLGFTEPVLYHTFYEKAMGYYLPLPLEAALKLGLVATRDEFTCGMEPCSDSAGMDYSLAYVLHEGARALDAVSSGMFYDDVVIELDDIGVFRVKPLA